MCFFSNSDWYSRLKFKTDGKLMKNKADEHFRVCIIQINFHFQFLLNITIGFHYNSYFTNYTVENRIRQRVLVTCVKAVGVCLPWCHLLGPHCLFIGQRKKAQLLSFLLLFPLICHNLGSPHTSESRWLCAAADVSYKWVTSQVSCNYTIVVQTGSCTNY